MAIGAGADAARRRAAVRHGVDHSTSGRGRAGDGAVLQRPAILAEMIALTGMPIRVYGTFTSLEPAMGALKGLLVLRELPTSAQLIGIAAIVVASLGTALFGA